MHLTDFIAACKETISRVREPVLTNAFPPRRRSGNTAGYHGGICAALPLHSVRSWTTGSICNATLGPNGISVWKWSMCTNLGKTSSRMSATFGGRYDHKGQMISLVNSCNSSQTYVVGKGKIA